MYLLSMVGTKKACETSVLCNTNYVLCTIPLRSAHSISQCALPFKTLLVILIHTVECSVLNTCQRHLQTRLVFRAMCRLSVGPSLRLSKLVASACPLRTFTAAALHSCVLVKWTTVSGSWSRISTCVQQHGEGMSVCPAKCSFIQNLSPRPGTMSNW